MKKRAIYLALLILSFILYTPIAMAGFTQIQKVNIDANPAYDNYDRKEITFSQSLKTVAYPTKKDNKVYIAINGKTGENGYDCIATITFLPSTERVAFLASKDGCKNLFWVVDGKEYSGFISAKSHTFAYSPKIDRFAFVAEKDKKEFIVIDGEPQKKSYDRIDFVSYMPDGETLIYKAKEKDNEFLVINDKEQKRYKMIRDIRFSAFSDVFYLASDGHTEFLVINGKEQQRFAGGVNSYCFSPDSRRFITISNDKKNIIVYIDKKTLKFPLMNKSRSLYCTFAPDSKSYAFIAPDSENSDKTSIFLNGEKIGTFENILWSTNPNLLVFSPDSSKLAYIIREKDKETLFINKEKLTTHDKFYKLLYSPDSRHIVYSYQDKEEQIGFSLGLDNKSFRNISSLSENENGPAFIFDGSDRIRYIYEDNSGFYFIEEIVN